jgi:outer membrane receptor protein involved in Fe transport
MFKPTSGALAGAALACALVTPSFADDPSRRIADASPFADADGGGGGIPTPQEMAEEVIEVHDKAPLPDASLLEPDPLSASDAVSDAHRLALRPHRRVEDLAQEVPGLFTVQHAGGGKAQQYFLRGFDLDHGTDLAGFIDGVPINAVSHAHGQGFLDLHFLIPETIDMIESTKGPYSVRVGDFATAGAVGFHVVDHVDESIGKIELGTDGHRRVVALDSPNLGDKWRALFAAEAFGEDGPFIHPENFVRLSALAKLTRYFDDRGALSLEFMGYSGTWNMSGVLPARAVCGESDGTPTPAAYAGARCIKRFDSIDPSQGGASQRYMMLAAYRKPLRNGDVELRAYGVSSSFQLYPNDGIAAAFQPAGIQYGSQVEQDDARFVSGVDARIARGYEIGGMPLRTIVGLSIRNDAIQSEAHRDMDRQRLDGMPGIPGPIVDSNIRETESAAYAEGDWRPHRRLRFVFGGRVDRVDVDVRNASPTAIDQVSGYRGQLVVSPKVSAIARVAPELDVFANFGRGFHSNDARTLIVGQATTLLAIASGYELGTAVRPLPGLELNAAAFLLDLSSEQTIDGDTASTTPSGPTRRYGVELALRYRWKDRVYAEAAYTWAHARYTDAADIAAGQSLVALAPKHTFAAQLGALQPIGKELTLIGSLDVRAMSDRPATADGALTATGFVVCNGLIGARWRRYDATLQVINIADTAYREGQFAVASRLPGEGPNPPTGISFTPGVPREFLFSIAARWH